MAKVMVKKSNEQHDATIVCTMEEVWQYIGPDTLQMIQENDGRSYAKS